MLVDKAMVLIAAVIPETGGDELRVAVEAGVKELNRWGLTGIHDAGVARETIAVYEQLATEKKFPLRNYVMVANSDAGD